MATGGSAGRRGKLSKGEVRGGDDRRVDVKQRKGDGAASQTVVNKEERDKTHQREETKY